MSQETKRISRLLVGISASIGITSMPNYVRTLRRAVADEVFVMMTPNSTRFVTPYTFEVLTGNPVFTDSMQISGRYKVPHIQLTGEAEAFLVMPASADVIGKAANGICDDIVTTSILAAACPVLFVPSMNERMWNKPVLARNLERLVEVGYHYVEPVFGQEISSGSRSFGAMPKLQQIVDRLYALLSGAGGLSSPQPEVRGEQS